MRKLVLIALVLLNVNSFSQILFSESFSTLTLNSYTAANGSGVFTIAPSSFISINDSHNNNVGTFVNPNTPFNYSALKTQGWLIGYNANENDTFLVSTSWLDSTSVTSDKWIITPAITVSLSNTVLRWRAMSPDPNFRDGYEVYTTTVTSVPTKTDFPLGNRIFTLVDNNTSGGGENAQWTNRSVLLDAFVGQTIRFAFRNNSKDRFQLWIDDIQVATVSSLRDVAINKVGVKKYNLINVNDSVHVTFTNLGSTPITTLALNYTYGTSTPVTYTFTNALGWGNTSVNRVTFPQVFNFTSLGIYSVTASATAINGQVPQNTGDDALSVNVTAINSSVPRAVLMENFVSAYDGDSPDAQEKAQAISSSSLIVVNVHDNDTMEIADATSLFFDYKKSNSTALFDRYYFADINKVAVSKNMFATRSASRIAAVSPASVTIINKTYNTSTRQLSFDVKVDFVGEVKGDYRINAYLTENNVYGNPSDTSVNGYNQLNNYYSVPWSPYYLKGYFSNAHNSYLLNAWQYRHQNVLIKAFDGMYGLPGTIPVNGGTTGNSYSQTFTLTLPTLTTGVHQWIEDNIYIVGFVAELGINVNERTVLNAAKEKITASAEVIGIEENPFQAISFSMFPNPNNGELYISLLEKQLNKNLAISVKNMIGRMVYSGKLYSTMRLNELSLKALPDGAYVIEIEQNGHKSSQKLIIQH
ncbi:MAG: T9SS type A sorting domain-containing protein [Sphingobacteriaceae bacterium]|nr:T9SS type A sorting domain-containing protein [Sphingobacteriaceae bacterium]